MDEVKIESIREAIKVFEDTLNNAILELEQHNQIGIERLKTIDNYKLVHPRGVAAILYQGSTYESVTKGRTMIMKRIIVIGVAVIIRFIDNPRQQSDEYYVMMPADYVDFIVNKISGVNVFNHLPEFDRKIYPIRDELIDEQDYVWRYLIHFGVPVDFIEN